jgi:hypothetical protein
VKSDNAKSSNASKAINPMDAFVHFENRTRGVEMQIICSKKVYELSGWLRLQIGGNFTLPIAG